MKISVYILFISIVVFLFPINVKASNPVLYMECKYELLDEISGIKYKNNYSNESIKTITVGYTEMKKTTNKKNFMPYYMNDGVNKMSPLHEMLNGIFDKDPDNHWMDVEENGGKSAGDLFESSKQGKCPHYMYLAYFGKASILGTSKHELRFLDTLTLDCTSANASKRCPVIWEVSKNSPTELIHYVSGEDQWVYQNLPNVTPNTKCDVKKLTLYMNNSLLYLKRTYGADNEYSYMTETNIMIKEVGADEPGDTKRDPLMYIKLALIKKYGQTDSVPIVYKGDLTYKNWYCLRYNQKGESTYGDPLFLNDCTICELPKFEAQCTTLSEVQASAKKITMPYNSTLDTIDKNSKINLNTYIDKKMFDDESRDWILDKQKELGDLINKSEEAMQKVEGELNKAYDSLKTGACGDTSIWIESERKRVIEQVFFAITKTSIASLKAIIKSEIGVKDESGNYPLGSYFYEYEKYWEEKGLLTDKKKDILEAQSKEASGISDSADAAIKEISKKQEEYKKRYDLLSKLSKGEGIMNINSEEGCSVLKGEFQDFLTWIFRVIQIGGMILAFVLGIVDFMTAAASEKDDAMKKAGKRFTTRLIVLAILLILPALINFILGIVNLGIISENPTCGIIGL